MKRPSVLSAALFAVAILPATGCVDWSIAAPAHALVLARDDGDLPARLMTSHATPLIRQRQIGFVSFPPWSGTALWRADEFFSSSRFSARVEQPLQDVVFVTGYHFKDLLLTLATYGILTSHQVRVYANVR